MLGCKMIMRGEILDYRNFSDVMYIGHDLSKVYLNELSGKTHSTDLRLFLRDARTQEGYRVTLGD